MPLDVSMAPLGASSSAEPPRFGPGEGGGDAAGAAPGGPPGMPACGGMACGMVPAGTPLSVLLDIDSDTVFLVMRKSRTFKLLAFDE